MQIPLYELKKSSKTKQKKITCFTTTSKDRITSPEYKMSSANQMKTRHQSKQQGKKDKKPPRKEEENESEISDTDGEGTHTAILPCPEEIDIEAFEKEEMDVKFAHVVTVVNHLCSKLTETDVIINHDTEGVNTRITTGQLQLDKVSKDINVLSDKLQTQSKELLSVQEEISTLKTENSILRGTVQRYSKQLQDMSSKMAMLTAKSMEKNVTISGIKEGGKKEDCKDAVIKFLKAEVEIDVDENEIYVAHRIGKYQKDKRRLLLARCGFKLREHIFANVKNLKDKVNDENKPYYINKQLPEQIIEQNRNIRHIIKQQKQKDKGLPVGDRSSIEVKDKVVYIDEEPQEPDIKRILCAELFPDKSEKVKQDKLNLVASDPVSKQGSTFTAFAIKTGQLHEVNRGYRKIRRMHPAAEHVIAACTIRSGPCFQDDGEWGAGYKLLQHIKDGPDNVAVFVVRVHQGINLGADRHTLIKQVADQAIDRLTKHPNTVK